ncbi:MAG: FtsW/RodA/SpoVE family cell cycle protein [Firmicutes bacterium]|nr:FtsW/RodA/SpoVE family cell cycle protein [Bacillota bacterium]MCM1401250.1 FtsW/RodA/SpoVE family cell cycle protein [Bacteroides sp.]MCM1477201.1 FtsW/RodA/SpoVE family cell cycle protein [Bacteroides sp.]
MNRISPFISYLLCAAMFVLGCISMTNNFSAQLSDTEKDLITGHTVVLDANLKADTLNKLLMECGYFTDPVDARLVADWITAGIAKYGAPENLGALNRTVYKMQAEKAYKEGGTYMRERVGKDYKLLGMDAEWYAAKNSSLTSDFGNGPALLKVKVFNDKNSPNAPLGGITVRLREHSIDSVDSKGGKVDGKEAFRNSKTLGYAVTDASGEARFHLQPGKSYSVVPIAEGYQYGREKGTTADGKMPSAGLNLSFRQQTHVITPFDTYTYQAIKADRTFIVRTPAQFKDSIATGAAIFLIGWLAMFMFTAIRDRKLGTRSDFMLLSLIMILTGIGLLAMYAMTNPLADKDYGFTMAKALGMGLVAMALVSCLNMSKFFAGKSKLQFGSLPFDPIDKFMSSRKKKRSLTRTNGLSFSTGFSYLLCAVGLIFLLAMFGSGPEGSDARVNLGGFQPSEVCKYLILIFVAAFFAENSLLLQAFSAKLTPLSARRQVGTIAVLVGVMLALMMLYLLVLSDMGPALVVLVTFIFLYSMARRDFAQLLIGLLSFIGLMLLARAINNTPVTLIVAAAFWFVAWIAFGWFKSRQIYESAIIVNLLIVVFALGGPLLKIMGAESEAARLTNRTAMSWGGQWDNHVHGGDQVAQGIWSAATGGATGMGLGNGSPSVVPAFHTDMAFTSIGEMLGLTGLVLVIVCFVLLIHRSLLIGRRAGQPFTMYLVMGIALLTGVQFLFIVFASLGIVPLSGVTVPFLSYSRTSLIASMAAFGVVLSASRTRATESQRKYAQSFSGAIAASVLMFIIGALVIIGTLANYQIVNKNETLIRPAKITNTMGARIIEYNPRIGMVLNRLNAGNIYDTNGLLLATSVPDSLLNAIPSIVPLGFDAKELQKEAHKRKDRYYTMGDHLLFILGDAGSKKVLGYQDSDPIGFMAESRYAGELRGLDIPLQTIELKSHKYRPNRFMPEQDTTFHPKKRDYTSVIPFLKYGIYNNPLIKEFNERREERDMYLTVDAALQKKLQDAMASYFPASEVGRRPRLRASAVVLNAITGDFLASANYPLPNQDSIIMLNDAKIYGDAPFEQIKGHAPITERDLGMTFQTAPGSTAKIMTALAAFKAFGPEADKITYKITMDEEIERRGDLTGEHFPMITAIQKSSNNYFIHLLHDKSLHSQLGQIYEAVGARLHRNQSASTYFFNLGELNNSAGFNSELAAIQSEGMRYYNYITHPPRPIKDVRRAWLNNDMAIAWGQGALRATPLMMARVASIVANGGKLAPTRYVKSIGGTQQPYPQQINVVGATEAGILKHHMQLESQRWNFLPNHPGDERSVAGKTGTPERGDYRNKLPHSNDAWYICILFSQKLNSYLAVALRLERTPGFTSSSAAKAVGNCIIPTLNAAGYQIY